MIMSFFFLVLMYSFFFTNNVNWMITPQGGKDIFDESVSFHVINITDYELLIAHFLDIRWLSNVFHVLDFVVR